MLGLFSNKKQLGQKYIGFYKDKPFTFGFVDENISRDNYNNLSANSKTYNIKTYSTLNFTADDFIKFACRKYKIVAINENLAENTTKQFCNNTILKTLTIRVQE